jgi:hypothetical protein
VGVIKNVEKKDASSAKVTKSAVKKGGKWTVQVDSTEIYLKNNDLVSFCCLSEGCISVYHEIFSFVSSPSSQGFSQNWVLDRRWPIQVLRQFLHFCRVAQIKMVVIYF